MNILIYALVLITAMAVTFLARLPSTVRSNEIHKGFLKEISSEDSQRLQEQADKLYDTTPQSSGEEKSVEERGVPAAPRSSPLHARVSVYRAIKEPSSFANKLVMVLLEQFLGGTEWYSPSLAAEVFHALDPQLKDHKLKKVEDLAEIDLGNEHLQIALVKMIQQGLTDCGKNREIFDLSKTNRPLSIYLAREPLLVAIYQDPHTVAQIVEFRRQIYKEINNGGDKKELSEQFKLQFGAGLNESEISFQVSTTKPPEDDKKEPASEQQEIHH